MQHLDPTILNAYIQTAYTVTEWRLTIRIGNNHPQLDRWLKKMHRKTWAYLTAWNPHSTPLSLKENCMRQAALLNDLTEWPVFSGQGIPDNGDWHAEESILIPGMQLDHALRIARKWEQFAFLYGEIDGKARLIWCTDV